MASWVVNGAGERTVIHTAIEYVEIGSDQMMFWTWNHTPNALTSFESGKEDLDGYIFTM